MRTLLTKVFLFTILTLTFIAWSPTAHAGLNGFMTIEGDTQGKFTGGVAQAGREGTIRVLSLESEIVAPIDAASGLLTGRRRHKPLRLTVELDRAMPQLMHALAHNERLPEVTVRMFTPDRAGREVNHYTVKLTNARLARFRIEARSATAEQAKLRDSVHLEIAYQQIEVVWNDGGITAMDDWGTPEATRAPTRPATRKAPSRPPTTRPAPKARLRKKR